MAVLAILVAALVIVATLFGGFGSAPSKSTTTPSSGATFASALAVADQFVTAHGTWNLTAAVGVASPATFKLPYNGTPESPSCSIIALAGSLPANLSIPAFAGSLVSGSAPAWAFAYWSPSTGAQLALMELSGQVELAVEESSGCTGMGGVLPGTVPSNVVDSPAAVAAASAEGGASFLEAHPTGVSLIMTLNGTLNYSTSQPIVNPTWDIEWSSCASTFLGYPPSSGFGYEFTAMINATSGRVIPGTVWNGTCGMSRYGSLGLSVELGQLYQGTGTGGTIASQGCRTGDFCYSVFIAGSYDNVTPANFSMSVWNMSNEGSTFAGTVGFSILNRSGAVIVYSLGPVENQWTSGVGDPETLLTAGMSFTVDMGTANPSGGSWALALTGEGAYASAGTSAVGL